MRWTRAVNWKKALTVGSLVAAGAIFVFSFILLSATQVQAQQSGSVQIYTEAQLAKNDRLYRNYVDVVFREDVLGQLPITERPLVSDVRLVLAGGVHDLSPLAVGADVEQRVIYFPIQTIAFLDDISALAAWLAKRDCSFETVGLYAGMLAIKSPPEGNSLYPNPREVFGLGDDIWNDNFVKTESNKAFKTMLVFILAHELGHIRYGHKRSDAVTEETSQQQELEADRYAIECMRHIGLPPTGMFYFFTAQARMEGHVPTTHPLSGARLEKIAAAMDKAPEEFVPPDQSVSKWAPVIQKFASKFLNLIHVVDNPILRGELASQARTAAWTELRQRCPN